MPRKDTYPYIPVFWNGTHKNAGKKKDWTAEDVKKIFTASTEQDEKRIPFTIDHPKNDLPVIGWTEKGNLRLVEEGDKVVIEAKPTEFSPETLAAVKDSGRKKISIALRAGDLSIKHIGLVEKPAVKGLPAIPFKEDEAIVFSELESKDELFMGWKTASALRSVGAILSDMRDYFIEEKGVEATNKILDKWNIKWLLEAKADETKAEIKELFSLLEEKEGKMPNKTEPSAEFKEELDTAKQELETSKRELETAKQELEKLNAEKRELEFNAFLDKDELKGKLTPAIKAKSLRLMNSIHSQEEYEFTESDKTVKKTPLVEFQELLAMLPDQVTFGVHGQGQQAADDNSDVPDKLIDEFNKKRTQ